MKDTDRLVSMCIINDDSKFILVATKNGLGKLVKITDMVKKPKVKNMINDGFPIQKRSSNSKGRLCLNLNDGDELLMATMVSDNDDIVIISNKILGIKTSSIPVSKRPSKGSKLIDNDGNKIKDIVIIKDTSI